MWFFARSTLAKPPVISELIIILANTLVDLKPRLCYKIKYKYITSTSDSFLLTQ